MDISSTGTLVAALGQTRFEQQVGISILKNEIQQQQDVVALIAPAAGNAGGMVTQTRGQTLNTTL